MTTKLTVVVAGSTGMLGYKIVDALLNKGDVNVRAMVRSLNDSNEKNWRWCYQTVVRRLSQTHSG